MKLFKVLVALALAFVVMGAVSAQVVVTYDPPEVVEAKAKLGIDELRYTPVQSAQSGWYYDPEVKNQGFLIHVGDDSYEPTFVARGINLIWFLGDTNDDGKSEWYYTTATPDRFNRTYPVYLVEGIEFPALPGPGSLVQHGSVNLFSLDCSHFLAQLTVDGLSQTFNAQLLVRSDRDATCYTCPAIDFAPLPEQCRY